MPVDSLSEWKGLESVAFVGNDGRRATLQEEGTKRRGVIGLVRQQLLRRGKLLYKGFRNDPIINIAPRQQESYRPAFAIRERVDFARAAAPADTERLAPFLPCAAR